MSYPFERFHHLCIVVHDIDEKIEYFDSIGLGPWTEYPPLSEYTEVDVVDVEGFKNLRYVQTYVGDMEIQLVQPGEGESPQKDFLEKYGEGVYHIAFAVDDVNKGEKVLEGRGLKTKSRGRRPDQSGFNYFDTQQEAGVTLLIRKSAEHRK